MAKWHAAYDKGGYLMAARILVINDNDEIREMYRDLLETEGYEVVLAGTPFQDIQEVEGVEPDLIILDLIFGHENRGWQMLQLLKLHRSTARIPVIVCTAATNAVREMEGYLSSKGCHLVLKPFDIDELFATVRQGLAARENDAYFWNPPASDRQCWRPERSAGEGPAGMRGA
jgi:DNA-binding response OmpR family regulator